MQAASAGATLLLFWATATAQATVVEVRNAGGAIAGAHVIIQTLEGRPIAINNSPARTDHNGQVNCGPIDPAHQRLVIFASHGDERGTVQIVVTNGAFPQRVVITLRLKVARLIAEAEDAKSEHELR